MRSPPRLSKDSHQYTLQDVWYALSHHDVFDHEFWLEVTMQILFTRCVSLFGRALVLLVICLVGALGYVGVYVALPRIAAPHSFLSYVHTILGLFVLFNIYFNYYFAVTVSPGHPDGYNDGSGNGNGYGNGYGNGNEMKYIEEGNSSNGIIEPNGKDHSQYKQCKKCNSIKPPRAHHCSVCKKCVLKMDHHCPYVANCVGYYNYRYFFLFLFWTALGTFYLSVVCGFAGFVSEHGSSSNGVLPYIMGISESKFDAIPSVRERPRSRVVGRLRKGRNGSENEAIQETITSNEAEEEAGIQSFTTIDSLPVLAEVEVPEGTTLHYRFSSMLGTNFVSNTLTTIFRAKTNTDMFAALLETDVQILLSFVTSIGVCVAVGCLFGFHLALVRSGQTTIEYYESWTTKYKLMKSGRVHKNEYDRGLNKNIESVLGNQPWYLAILPSFRKPPPLIVPHESPTLFAWQQRLLREQNAP